MKLATPIKWHGGKHYLAARIIELMPPHERYLEAFSGGLSVLIQKPLVSPKNEAGKQPAVAEFANDLNGDLVNFWRVLANAEAFETFRRIVEATPLSQPSFKAAASFANEHGNPDAWFPDVDRAVSFFIRIRQSRQGLGKDYCTPTKRTRRGMNENASAWLSAVDGLADIHQRLRRVEVWQRPAVAAIRKLDGAELLVYADPPYLPSTRSTVGEYGPHEMTPEQHAELLECLAQMRGRFILSGYRSDLYNQAAERNGWTCYEFDLPNNASGSRSKERRIECVWMNY